MIAENIKQLLSLFVSLATFDVIRFLIISQIKKFPLSETNY